MTYPSFRQNLVLFCLAAGAVTCGVACNDKGDAVATDCVSAVERAQVLATAEEAIRFRLSDLVTSVGALDESLVGLGAAPGPATLSAARQSLIGAWFDYQRLMPYGLVVDPSAALDEQVGPFPADTTRILRALGGDGFDPTSAPSFDRGFAALEFLLFARDSAAVVEQLSRSPERGRLAVAYGRAIRERIEALSSDWADGGAADFRSQVGTDAGSGVSRLINAINKHFEDVRRDQLGLPFGASLGFPTPRVAQAPYSGRSLALLRVALDASALAFGFPTDDGSLAAYVAHLTNPEGAALAQDIFEQYRLIARAVQEVRGPLTRAVLEDRDRVQALYTAMSRQVVYLKTDLPAVSCVAITYLDNPSDSD